MKKISIFLCLILILGFVGVTTADTNIKDTMDFQGETVNLTFDQALEKAKINSIQGKKLEWNKEKARGSYFDNYQNASQLGAMGARLDEEMLTAMADFSKAYVDKNYEAEINVLKTTVMNQYYGVLQLGEVVHINKENVAIKEKLYKDTLVKFDLGLLAQKDVLTAEYDYIKAQTDYELAINNYNKAKMGFNLFLGLDPMKNTALTDNIIYAEMPDISLSKAVSEALIHRNEIEGLKIVMDIQDIGFKKASARYSDRTATYINAKVAYEEAKHNYENIFKQIEVDVRAKYMDMVQKKNAIEAGKKAVEKAEATLKMTNLSFELGMALVTDVQQVQAMVMQSKLGLSQAILDYNLAVDAFNASIGSGTTSIHL
jgi:outer membrane protein TolC